MRKSLVLLVTLSMIFVFAACGNGDRGEQENANTGGNQGEVEGNLNELDGELPEIIATGSNMFIEPEYIVNYFAYLHFIWEYREDEYVDIIYEWQGEEEVDGFTADKIYVSIDYEDPFYDGYDMIFG